MRRVPAKSAFKAVLFDLGNTLYDKSQYLQGAFKEVADHLFKTHQLAPDAVLDLLNRIWKVKTSHYEFLFSDLLEILGIYSAKLLEELVNVYHSHRPRLKPYPGVDKLLKDLKKQYKIGLVTDGHPQMQRNKIAALGWAENTFDVIIYATEYSKGYLKPNPFIYQLALEKLGVSAVETVFVGDNPYEDFKGAKELGIFTVRVKQGEFKTVRLSRDREADVSIDNITDLPLVLAGKIVPPKEPEMSAD